MNSELDTITIYQTPEGIELNLSVAGPLSRGLAWFIDLGIRIVVYIVIGMLLSWTGGVGTGLTLVGLFLIEWFYPVLFEVHSGMTPGKRVLGILVVNDDGTPVGWSSSLLRNLIRSIDLLPLFNMVGLTTMLFNDRFQRLGDFAAGTIVIYRRTKAQIPDLPTFSPQPPPTPLKIWEQRLILDYCERSSALSNERKAELAGLLPSLTGSSSAENTLMAMGNWYTKGRLTDEPETV